MVDLDLFLQRERLFTQPRDLLDGDTQSKLPAATPKGRGS
jgi:hypothetical protein